MSAEIRVVIWRQITQGEPWHNLTPSLRSLGFSQAVFFLTEKLRISGFVKNFKKNCQEFPFVHNPFPDTAQTLTQKSRQIHSHNFNEKYKKKLRGGLDKKTICSGMLHIRSQ